MIKSFAIIVAGASLAAISIGANAERILPIPAEPLVRVAISYGDLDLARDRDIERLTQRVRQAARNICQVSGGVYLPQKWRAAKRCSETAFARAAVEIRLAVATARNQRGLAASSARNTIMVSR